MLEELAVDRLKIDLMGDLIPLLIAGVRRVEIYLTDAFWYDVGSTEKYEKLDNELIDRLFDTVYYDSSRESTLNERSITVSSEE